MTKVGSHPQNLLQVITNHTRSCDFTYDQNIIFKMRPERVKLYHFQDKNTLFKTLTWKMSEDIPSLKEKHALKLPCVDVCCLKKYFKKNTEKVNIGLCLDKSKNFQGGNRIHNKRSRSKARYCRTPVTPLRLLKHNLWISLMQQHVPCSDDIRLF